MFLSEVPLFLLVLLPSSKGNCCNRLNISLSGRAAHNHPEVSGIYVKDSIGLNGKPTYSKITGSWTWKISYIGYWNVYKIDAASKFPRVKEAIYARAACPIHTNWQYHCWSCRPQTWVKDSTILVNCEKVNIPSTTQSTTQPTEETISVKSLEGPKTKVIIGSVGGGLLFMGLTSGLVFWLWKYRDNDPENDDQVDENPVYMDNYEDPDTNNEIYDRNAYYAAEDMEERAEISTVAQDLNPEYETSL